MLISPRHFQDYAVAHPTVPKRLHWIWVGDTRLGEHAFTDICETARLAPGFEKTIWTNKPSLIYGAIDHGSSRQQPDIDAAAALTRAGIRLRSIDELLTQPAIGLSRGDCVRLSSLVHRDILTPLANRASASDILRILALHREGGIYLDVDFMPHRKRKAHPFLNLITPNADDRRAETLRSLRAGLRPGKNLLTPPETRHGFAMLGQSGGSACNNSMLAAAAAGTGQTLTTRALRMIVQADTAPTLSTARVETARLKLTLVQRLTIHRRAGAEVRESARISMKMRQLCGFTTQHAVSTPNAASKRLMREDMKSALRHLQAYRLLLDGAIDAQTFSRLQVAISASELPPVYRATADERLALSWEAKRLRPRTQAQIDAVMQFQSNIALPTMLLTRSMTGPGLLAAAALCEPRLETPRAPQHGYFDAYRSELEVLRESQLDQFQPFHPFFSAMPPADNPSLAPLERIDYAHDAPAF